MTPSEEILSRYQAREKVADDLGRLLTLRPLRPSQSMAVLRLVEPDANPDYVGSLLVAASVEKVSGHSEPSVELYLKMPRSLEELNSTIDMLDREGMRAAIKGYVKLNGGAEPEVEPVASEARDGA